VPATANGHSSANSFARIHRSNLVAQGIVPLVLADEDDCDRVELGQPWSIPVDLDNDVWEAETPFGHVTLEPRLTLRERDVLRAGGLLAYAGAPRLSATATSR
jgi:aconitate hydratase